MIVDVYALDLAMPQPPPTEKSLKNLKDRSAPDKPGDTVATTVRVKTDDLEWLKGLDHGVSYHIRQALKLYREQLANNRK